MLEDYAAKNGFSNVAHFTDDGFSGGNFDRPDWKRLIAEIESGNVDTVITKDMSRVGRDYLQVGFYTEVFFREKGVRFIAITNNIDSQNRDSGEFAPFLNVINEWHIRDASRKVTAVLRAKGLSGKRTSNNAIYGYRKDPSDKDIWLIDDEAASVVRRIFQMTIEGMGPYQIARLLQSERIYCPSYYLAQRKQGTGQSKHFDNPYNWRGSSVRDMIAKPEYIGNTVNFRSYKESYKDKRPKKTLKENLVIFDDTHEPIIDKGTWETAQRCRKTVRRTDTWGEANPLTGLMFCAGCGAKMYNHRGLGGWARDWHGNLTGERRPFRDEYNCSAYDLAKDVFTKKCSQHYIRTEVVRSLLLDAIKAASSFARENEAEFIRQVREASALRHEETAKSHKKLLTKHKKRHAELDTLFKKVFEEYSAGKLTEKRYELLSGDYEREQEELGQSIARLQSELEAFEVDSSNADRFIEISKKYTDFTELTTPMILEFVEKILVHEGNRSSGRREQRVDIYLNFIGLAQYSPPTEIEIMDIGETVEERKRQLYL